MKERKRKKKKNWVLSSLFEFQFQKKSFIWQHKRENKKAAVCIVCYICNLYIST